MTPAQTLETLRKPPHPPRTLPASGMHIFSPLFLHLRLALPCLYCALFIAVPCSRSSPSPGRSRPTLFAPVVVVPHALVSCVSQFSGPYPTTASLSSLGLSHSPRTPFAALSCTCAAANRHPRTYYFLSRCRTVFVCISSRLRRPFFYAPLRMPVSQYSSMGARGARCQAMCRARVNRAHFLSVPFCRTSSSPSPRLFFSMTIFHEM
ncbi:hypothetical protein C8Q79DRAFT_701798 [Trametes meyenii]|nr:hypothetical protein C8Q79DRAFT_701798 [Trametes meyenii]